MCETHQDNQKTQCKVVNCISNATEVWMEIFNVLTLMAKPYVVPEPSSGHRNTNGQLDCLDLQRISF